MELLLDHGAGDPNCYAPLAEKLATTASAAGETHRGETYWNLAARWWRRANDEPRAQRATTEAAELFVREAEAAEKRGSAFVAALQMQKAIATFRRVPNTKTRVDELHERLLEYQARSVSEFKEVTASADITELVAQAVKAVEGKTLREAFVNYAKVSCSEKVAVLREEAERTLAQYPMQGLFETVLVNEAGKVTGRKAAAGFGTSGDEQALSARMFEQARLHQTLSAHGAIEPCRRVLNREHPITLSTFLSIVRSSPFVPPGRELLFATGLMAGMEGDYLTAAHILIPQVEHTMRWYLAGEGIITSSLDQDGIQEEFDLNRVFHSPEQCEVLGKFIGENTVFELRGLLVERAGSNLRNLMSHGLLSDNAFLSPAVCYLWWLVLRLCILGILAAERHASQPPTPDGSPN